MGRRTLLAVVAAGLLAAPLAAQAPNAQKIPRIGYLSLGAAVQPILIERLREAGYVEGQNVRIDYRFGEGKHDALGALAGELVGLNVDVIMAYGDEAIVAAKKRRRASRSSCSPAMRWPSDSSTALRGPRGMSPA